ncbi:MAG: hypothetical protein ACLFQ6_12525, partial [Candidatus Sumerlaeia bacterium]
MNNKTEKFPFPVILCLLSLFFLLFYRLLWQPDQPYDSAVFTYYFAVWPWGPFFEFHPLFHLIQVLWNSFALFLGLNLHALNSGIPVLLASALLPAAFALLLRCQGRSRNIAILYGA